MRKCAAAPGSRKTASVFRQTTALALVLFAAGMAAAADDVALKPNLDDPEAFVTNLIRASVVQNRVTRKAMENYAFHEELAQFRHLKDGSLKPDGTRVNWNYFSKKYGVFRSVPLSVNGKETTQRDREKHASAEEKHLDKYLREKEKREKQRAEERARKRAEEEKKAKEEAASSPPPPAASEPEKRGGAAAQGEPEARETRKVDERKAKEMGDQHATPTEGLDEITDASVNLGWAELSISDIVRHFAFAYEGDEDYEGERVHVVRFVKREDVVEPDRELRKAVPPVEGRLWIDPRTNAVARMDMALLKKYKPGGTLKVKELTFSFRAQKVDGMHWFDAQADYAVQASFFGLFRFHEHGEMRRYDFKVFTVDVDEDADASAEAGVP
jgi:hypothetical protein